MIRRLTLLLLSSGASLSMPAMAAPVAPAAESAAIDFNIPASDLGTALNEAGQQASLQISFPYEPIAGRRAPAVKGRMPASAAIRQLITGSGLVISEIGDDHIRLVQGATASGDETVVTGYRLSNRRALASKRDSTQILDAVSQDEVSQLPDVNIVEASRRIPGISVIPERDSSRSRDNYQYVTIRGLDARYNLVTVDGAQIASADSSYRGAQLAMLPASLVSEIQAIKTVTSQYDPHALGGQINLTTKSAFDTGNFVTAQALGGWTSRDGKVAPADRANIRASGTAAYLFGAEKQFGLVVSGEYQRIQTSALASLPGDTGGGGWTYYTAAGAQTGDISNSTGRAVPVRVQDYAFTDKRERYSVNAKLEYRAGDRFGASLFGGYYHELTTENRYEALALPAAAYTPGPTIDSGTLRTGNYQLGVVTQPVTRSTWFINGDAHYDVTDNLKLTAAVSDSQARRVEDRWMYKWNTGMNEVTGSTTNLADYGYGYVNTNGTPSITLNNAPAAALASNYQPRYWRNLDSEIKNTVRSARGDIAWNFDANSRGLGLNAGINQTLTHVDSTLISREWLAKDPASALLIGNLDQYSQPTVLTPLLAPGIKFYLIDPAKARAVLYDHLDYFRQVDHTSDNNAAFYQLRESITAGYGQIGWRSDAVAVQAGVRYDDTRVKIGYLNKTVTGGTTSYPFQERNRGYSYWLPSGMATWNTTGRLKLRAGISETIGRPDYGQYGAATTTSYDGATLNISQGNPDLKPRRAWNYDVSGEYYLGAGGLISAALFYKDIKDEIFTRTTTTTTASYMGQTNVPTTISQPLNASSAMVKGAEVQIIKDRLDFLPGRLANLGVAVNATWLDGHFDFQMSNGATRRIGALFNQPDHIYNAQIFYTEGPVNLRLAFNRIGASPLSVDSSFTWRDIWTDSRDQLDLQASYYVTRWLQVTAQVQNLTNTAFEAHLGQKRELLQTRYPVGRTVWFGLVLKPEVSKR
ncbi:TonB-dependent receptor [Sphingomonas sp. AP4-R1]|uniref:TonB-dependent receptor n=1 Tax=Sphingomonas sp. AP4-R1 TaxID=2735134 RepID=UPI001493BF29|nr:TonB-dependent receptor [Sphingomonas sp. AP4-R1]QJU59873.1 TonB-dependent receptor [Sphingomonas sp. AP4-R1]